LASAVTLGLLPSACGSFGSAPRPDASVDASSDVNVAADATSDGGAALCTPGQHVLCDDFDGEPWPGDLWTNDINGGTLTRTTSQVMSSPKALELRLNDDVYEARSRLNKRVTATNKGLSCRFDLWLDDPTPAPADRATILEWTASGGGGSNYWFILTVENKRIILFDNGTGWDLGLMPVKAWVDVLVSAHYGVGVALSIEDQPRQRAELTRGNAKNRSISSAEIVIRAGLSRTDTGPGWHAFIDNIVCDVFTD
jgi:hypothetical protein